MSWIGVAMALMIPLSLVFQIGGWRGLSKLGMAVGYLFLSAWLISLGRW